MPGRGAARAAGDRVAGGSRPGPRPAPRPPPRPPPTGHESVAEALAEAVKREFGAHLDTPEIEAVRKELRAGLERGERLRRAARLSNAHEPVNRFEARPTGAPARGERR